MEKVIFQTFKGTIKGFGKNHAKAYCLILNNPNLSVSKISRKTGIARESCYRILCELEKFGLVESIPLKPIAYKPKNPKKAIEKMLNELTKKLETNKKKFLKTIQCTEKKRTLKIIFYNETKVDILKKGIPVRDKTEILKIKKAVDSIYARTAQAKV